MGREVDKDTSDYNQAIIQNSVNGKYTLTIDCEGLLTRNPDKPDIFTAKSADEAAQYFQLSTLFGLSILCEIKVKVFHTCGRMEVDDKACLTTLWSIGDWFVEQYRAAGKTAKCERKTDGKGKDWAEPDATLTIFVD